MEQQNSENKKLLFIQWWFQQGIHVAEPVIAMSIEPTDRNKADNFMKALTRFTKEDPTFRRSYDPEMQEVILIFYYIFKRGTTLFGPSSIYTFKN